MKVVHPSVYESRTRMYKKKSRAKNKIITAVLAVVVLYVSYCMTRTPEAPKITLRDIAISTPEAPKLGTYTESVSIGIEGFGEVAEVNGAVKRPTASTIKVLTALIILQKKPLGLDEKGPSISFDTADRAEYEKRYSDGESVVEVQPGQIMTEHEALEALMIGSANNIANKLAVWAFGSEKDFLTEARQYSNRIGLKDTALSDASGFAAETRSSARDLQIISSEAVQQPSLREIVFKKVTTIGAVNLVNTNKLLGVNGIEGIKTGYTDEAGACLLLSKKMTILGKERIVTSVVLGAQTREDAYRISEDILTKAPQYVQQSNMGLVGRVSGEAMTSWGTKADITLATNLDADSVLGTITIAKPVVKNSRPHLEGEEVGVMKVRGSEAKLVLKSDLVPPSIFWRLTHLK